MKTWKIVVGVVVLLAIAGGIYGSIQYSQKSIITVQTGRSARQDLTALVTAFAPMADACYFCRLGRCADVTCGRGSSDCADSTRCNWKEGGYDCERLCTATSDNGQDESGCLAGSGAAGDTAMVARPMIRS